ncbi:hypothetical protein [Roseococcus sp. YIM B11640]|uniref:hypothetical protein n=1 Tax=Roseococcus sp. YIM B11640 TaxID=3133973 RepID=UPI003C7A011A
MDKKPRTPPATPQDEPKGRPDSARHKTEQVLEENMPPPIKSGDPAVSRTPAKPKPSK